LIDPAGWAGPPPHPDRMAAAARARASALT
jgi:hypothetical protein